MQKQRKARQRGFTLIETLISMGVLSVGILSMIAFFTQGIQLSNHQQVEFIAQAKAQEALECIYTARNTQVLTWAQLNNVSQGGVFLDGPQPLLAAGPDGIVGTADDDPNNPNTIVIGPPGPDDVASTAGDKTINLNPWMTRTIAITPVANETNLNQVTVTINYIYQGQSKQFVMTSYITSYD